MSDVITKDLDRMPFAEECRKCCEEIEAAFQNAEEAEADLNRTVGSLCTAQITEQIDYIDALSKRAHDLMIGDCPHMSPIDRQHYTTLEEKFDAVGLDGSDILALFRTIKALHGHVRQLQEAGITMQQELQQIKGS